MGQVGSKMRHQEGGLAHWCPACESMHHFPINKPFGGARWTWDGNIENPTFAPSMNITVNGKDQPHYDPEEPTEVCHYNLKAGVIEYLGDCTHILRGQRIILPPLPVGLRDRPLTSDGDV